METNEAQNIHLKTDEELLFDFNSKKSTKSLGVLFDRYLTSAYQLAIKYMHNPADAEDAVQKAFINIIRFSYTYSSKGSVRSWIMQTVVNTCKNEIKHLIRHRKHFGEHAGQFTISYSDTNLEDQEMKTILLNAIDQLPEHFKIPIWLVHYENMTVKEVSGSLGKPEKTIRTQLTRGLEKLQNILGHQNATLQGINIFLILSQCKNSNQAPLSLIEKVKNILQMKISQKISIPPNKTSTRFSLILKAIFSLLLISGISIFLLSKQYKPQQNIKNHGLAEVTPSIQKNKETMKIPPFDLFCDFSKNELPPWCSLVNGEKLFEPESDDYGQCLKADARKNFILRLNIPNDKKYFKVSFLFKIINFRNNPFTYASIYEKNEGCVGYSFRINPNLNSDKWNLVELDVQDNICILRVNRQVSMFYVKTTNVEKYTIQTTGIITKIDNLKIQETEKYKEEDFTSIINLSKAFKSQKFIKPVIIPSPLPKISRANATVYWADDI